MGKSQHTGDLALMKSHVEPIPKVDTVEWTEHLRAEIAEAHNEWVNANRFLILPLDKIRSTMRFML